MTQFKRIKRNQFAYKKAIYCQMYRGPNKISKTKYYRLLKSMLKDAALQKIKSPKFSLHHINEWLNKVNK